MNVTAIKRRKTLDNPIRGPLVTCASDSRGKPRTQAATDNSDAGSEGAKAQLSKSERNRPDVGSAQAEADADMRDSTSGSEANSRTCIAFARGSPDSAGSAIPHVMRIGIIVVGLP